MENIWVTSASGKPCFVVDYGQRGKDKDFIRISISEKMLKHDVGMLVPHTSFVDSMMQQGVLKELKDVAAAKKKHDAYVKMVKAEKAALEKEKSDENALINKATEELKASMKAGFAEAKKKQAPKVTKTGN